MDGDTGALTGKWQNRRFVLSHFDGSRPLVAEVTPQGDGTLSIQLKDAYTPIEPLIAYSSKVARAKAEFDTEVEELLSETPSQTVATNTSDKGGN